jgi:hypothetical protein
MVVLSPLGCTQHKNEASAGGLFFASFGGRSFVHVYRQLFVFSDT